MNIALFDLVTDEVPSRLSQFHLHHALRSLLPCSNATLSVCTELVGTVLLMLWATQRRKHFSAVRTVSVFYTLISLLARTAQIWVPRHSLRDQVHAQDLSEPSQEPNFEESLPAEPLSETARTALEYAFI